MDIVFHFVDNQYPGKIVAFAFVIVAALFVAIVRFIWFDLLLQGVCQDDEEVSSACRSSAAGKNGMSREFLVDADVPSYPPCVSSFEDASVSEVCVLLAPQPETSAEDASFSSPSVSGALCPDHTNYKYASLADGLVLVTNPNMISAEPDVVFAGLSFDELCKLEVEERAYTLRISNLKTACVSSSPVVVAVEADDEAIDDSSVDATSSSSSFSCPFGLLDGAFAAYASNVTQIVQTVGDTIDGSFPVIGKSAGSTSAATTFSGSPVVVSGDETFYDLSGASDNGSIAAIDNDASLDNAIPCGGAVIVSDFSGVSRVSSPPLSFFDAPAAICGIKRLRSEGDDGIACQKKNKKAKTFGFGFSVFVADPVNFSATSMVPAANNLVSEIKPIRSSSYTAAPNTTTAKKQMDAFAGVLASSDVKELPFFATTLDTLSPSLSAAVIPSSITTDTADTVDLAENILFDNEALDPEATALVRALLAPVSPVTHHETMVFAADNDFKNDEPLDFAAAALITALLRPV
ncbi:unnamed protein product [Mucor circinelloides]